MPEMGTGASGTITYAYNPDGTLLRKTDPKGQKVEYGYDALNRLASVSRFAAGQSTPDVCQTVNFYYDTFYLTGTTYPNGNSLTNSPKANLTEIVTGAPSCIAGEITEKYDYSKGGVATFKRVTIRKDNPSPQFTRSTTLDWSLILDASGRPVTEYYPRAVNEVGNVDLRESLNHRIDYGYDQMERMNQMYWANSNLTGWDAPQSIVNGVAFKPSGQAAAISFAYWNRFENRTYNDLLQMTRLTQTVGGVTKMDMEYRFSATQNNGRITQSMDWVSGEEVTYSYDALQRLIAASTTGPNWGQSYTYDGFGNMSAQAVTKGSAPAFSLTLNSAKNQIANWVYDANGNVTSDGSRLYNYDVENRLVSTSSSGVVYAYDVDNRRIFDGSAYTFWAPDGRPILTYTLALAFNGALQSWEQVAKPQETRIYFDGKLVGAANPTPRPVVFEAVMTDRLGSVRVRGTQSMRYFPYGQEITATANGQMKFGTYFRDAATGLDYADQRYFTSAMGRFLTADPYVASGGPSAPNSWNRYAYVSGDPVNFADPSGRMAAATFCGAEYSTEECFGNSWIRGPGVSSERSGGMWCDQGTLPFIYTPTQCSAYVAAVWLAATQGRPAPRATSIRYLSTSVSTKTCSGDYPYGQYLAISFQVYDQYGQKYTGQGGKRIYERFPEWLYRPGGTGPWLNADPAGKEAGYSLFPVHYAGFLDNRGIFVDDPWGNCESAPTVLQERITQTYGVLNGFSLGLSFFGVGFSDIGTVVYQTSISDGRVDSLTITMNGQIVGRFP